MDWASLTTIIGAIFGSQVLTQAAQSWFVKKKTDADAASTLVQSMLEWQRTLTDRIGSLEKALTEKDQVIEELRGRLAQLESHVAKLESSNACITATHI